LILTGNLHQEHALCVLDEVVAFLHLMTNHLRKRPLRLNLLGLPGALSSNECLASPRNQKKLLHPWNPNLDHLHLRGQLGNLTTDLYPLLQLLNLLFLYHQEQVLDYLGLGHLGTPSRNNFLLYFNAPSLHLLYCLHLRVCVQILMTNDVGFFVSCLHYVRF